MRQALLTAARRLPGRLRTAADELVLDQAGVSDWFMVCGHAQSLYVRKRWGVNPLQGTGGLPPQITR